MAISTVTNRIEYQGNGTSATFAFPYRIDAQSHLSVFVFNSSGQAAGVITPMQLNAAGPFGYVFSGTANNQGIYTTGGNVIFNSTPNVQSAIVMFRSSVITSDFNVGQFGAIPATSLNNELDYLTMLQQRAQDLNTRSVRLKDGFYGNFDPTLPSNISQSPGKRLVVNSSATGWSFDETLQQYIPNTVVIATTNSSITSLGGDIPGRLLTSNGSSAPSWQGFNLNGGSVTGVLQVQNGGTGTGSTFNYDSLVYVGTSGIFTELLRIQWDDATNTLVVGTSAPASMRLNGILSKPIRTDASGNLIAGSTSLANEVSGINSVTNGGTGTGTSYTQYGVIYASSATQMGTIPSAQSGFVLTANGSSAPTFQAAAVTNSVSTKTANYVVTANDRYLLLNSSSFNITLTAAATNGKEISFRHINSSGVGAFFGNMGIVGSGVLINNLNSTSLSSYGEQLDLTFDSASLTWFGRRTIPSAWSGYNPNIIGFGSSTLSHAKWRRVGQDLEVDLMWRSATVQAVLPTIQLPEVTTMQAMQTGSSTIGSTAMIGFIASDLQSTNVIQWAGLIDPLGGAIRFGRTNQTQTDGILWKQTASAMFLSNTRYHLRGSFQVLGWEAT